MSAGKPTPSPGKDRTGPASRARLLQRAPGLDGAADSPAQRAAFDRDRPIALWINGVALAVGAASLVPLAIQRRPHGDPWVWVAALGFLGPLAALAIVLRGRGRFTIDGGGKGDPRPSLAPTFVVPPMMAALGPLVGLETLSLAPVFAVGALASVLLGALTWRCDRAFRGRRALMLLLLVPLMALPLSSAVLLVNGAADPSTPVVRSTTVLRKTYSGGRRGGYYLELAPWEPGMQRVKLRVSRNVFAGAREGWAVPVLTRPGLLGFPLAWVEASASSPPPPGGGAVDWARDFPHHHRGRLFDLHYQRAGWDATAVAGVADAFVELFDREFVPVRLERRLDVVVLPDRAALQRYLRDVLGMDLGSPMGTYLPTLGVLATYEDSGLGTFTHLIVRALVERALPGCPSWAVEGLPAFFEKFLGYWDGDRLVVQWGYQSPWRLQALGDRLEGLELARVVASDDRSPSGAGGSEARLVAVFLWQHGRLQRFLRLVAARDRAGFASYLEAAMDRPLAELVPLWQAYLAELAAHRAAALRIPPSAVYPDRAAFDAALAALRPWLAPGAAR